MLAGCARSVTNGRIVPSCCIRGRSSRRNAARLAVASLAPSLGSCVSVRATIGLRRSRRGVKSSVVSCNLFAWSSGCGESEDEDGDYLEAYLLLEETVSHYRMRMKGHHEGVKRQTSSQFYPFTFQADRPRIDQRTLNRFRNPTIFLKITFDGDFLLPIGVGEYAVEKLIEAIQQGETAECPGQFHFVGDFTEKVGCNMVMIRLTKRVVNTYFASIFLSEKKRFVKCGYAAMRCYKRGIQMQGNSIPIFVHKQIVFMDAVKLAYGRERVHDAKPVYDVTLDSSADGADILAEELDIVRNLNLAVKEERYNDAALWRDKLTSICKTKT